MKINHLLFAASIVSISSFTQGNEIIPMSDKYYQGKYFLINKIKNGSIYEVVYKSVFKTETVFSKMEVNCSNKKYRKVGEGINSINAIKTYSDKGSWITPTYQASHYDVVRFVCK